MTGCFPAIKRFHLFCCLGIGLMALLITAPVLLTGSWYMSHDGLRLPYLNYHFTEAFRHGILYPRWMPELMNGYGYPTFVFYQPGYFYFTLPFMLVMETLKATYASLFCMLFVGGVGAYRLARYYNTPWVSLMLSMVFLMHPYLARNIYIRGAYPEAYAMLLLPWCVYFALTLADRVRSGQKAWKEAAGFTIAVAMVNITHPYVALFAHPFLAGLLLVRSLWPRVSLRLMGVSLLLFALAMALTAPYWVTLLELKEAVRYRVAISGGYNPVSQAIDFESVFRFNPFTAMGLHKVLAVIGFLCAWRNTTLRYAFASYLFLMFMISDNSRMFWELGHDVLKFVQFRWRIYSVLATVGFLGVVQLGPWITKAWKYRPVVGQVTAIAFLLWVMYTSSGNFRITYVMREVVTSVYPGALFWDVFKKANGLQEINYYSNIQKMQKRRAISMTAGNEFMPKKATVRALPNRIEESIAAIVWHELYENSGTIEFLPETDLHYYAADVTVEDRAAVVINQFYFPGWHVEVNGEKLHWLVRPVKQPLAKSGFPDTLEGEGALDDNGLMLLYFNQPGTYRVEAYYDGPPGWLLRNIIVLLISAGLVLVLYRVLPNPPREAKEPDALATP